MCPYIEHEPLTGAGWQAWDVVIRCSGQLRLAPTGGIVIGIDLAAAVSIGTALGYDAATLAELLPAAEAGMLKAINRRLVSGDCGTSASQPAINNGPFSPDPEGRSRRGRRLD